MILLDDGSTDGSAALLEACRANPHVSHVELNPQNSGGYPFAQWEKGIRLAKGKYVWIAESDDRAEPTFLEKAVAAIEAHPAARICIVGSHVIDSEGKRMDFPQFDVWETPGGVYEYASDYFCLSECIAILCTMRAWRFSSVKAVSTSIRHFER